MKKELLQFVKLAGNIFLFFLVATIVGLLVLAPVSIPGVLVESNHLTEWWWTLATLEPFTLAGAWLIVNHYGLA
jgi:hypothetical protein